ncbi:MAG: Crp/Fnr family transcriptional regulator [Thermodesulfobacteriota bacterium]
MQESPYLDAHGFLVEKLQRLPFLGAIGDKYLKQMLRLSKIRKFDDREVITREGFFDSWVYILFSGTVKIVKDGREIARIDQTGETFGEMAAIDGKARSASAVSVGETVCLAIDAAFLREATEPLEQALFVSILYRLFAEVLAQRLRDTNEELTRVRGELEAAKKASFRQSR